VTTPLRPREPAACPAVRRAGWPALAGLALLLGACAATPEERIRADPAAFARLPPDAQAMIRQGQVGIGFDEFEVKLAVGDPTRITERVDASGTSRVWRYVRYETDDGVALYTGFYQRYYLPDPVGFPVYLDYPERRERETLRVIFQNGHVSAVERELP